MKKIITVIILSSLLFSCIPQNSQTVVVWKAGDIIGLWVVAIILVISGFALLFEVILRKIYGKK